MTGTEGQGERALTAVKDTLDDIKSRPHRQQVIIGVGSGLLAGYIFAKIGRVAALLLGGSLIALQCAVQQDVISINWRKVEHAGHQIQSNTPIIFEDKVGPQWVVSLVSE
ncbi:FUN14 domain-containing protein 1 [Schistosoma bovis]|uniref:FUN14 domain-containing protein 1 n=1 Tax=Schistosoma bovis TaxID=6184 RepID=A0A430Q805_SCHBO|nr:FUN14 domain-containing protein 1 [Schistosoma bovis]